MFPVVPATVKRMGMARTQCRSVLLVEDSEIDAHLTCNVLQECSGDIAVDLVSTAEEALTQIRKKPYDLIICDFAYRE